MQIEIDGAVRDYAFGMMSTIPEVRAETDEKTQGLLLMNMIELSCNLGFATYLPAAHGSPDCFQHTMKLRDAWQDLFSGKVAWPSDADEAMSIQLVGSRGRYLKNRNFAALDSMADWRSVK